MKAGKGSCRDVIVPIQGYPGPQRHLGVGSESTQSQTNAKSSRTNAL